MLVFYIHRLKSSRGFTLVEMVVTITIVGILAMIAVPRITNSSERAKSTEAVRFLEALRNAQITHILESGAYTNNFNDLEIRVGSSKYFENGTPLIPADQNDQTQNIASTQRIGGDYTLFINRLGDVCCTETVTDKCREVGFNGC